MKINEKIRSYIKLRRFHITILVVVCLMLTSCAVMTVDVDVYKGPLANHKDVQTQQVAAMAVGAKPLITRLKDDLKAQKKKKEEEKKDGLIKILTDIEGLYKDTKVLEMEAEGSSNIAILLKEGEVAFGQFRNEWEMLVPDNEYVELEKVGWKSFEEYKPGKSPLNEIVSSEEYENDLTGLRNSYYSFLVPELDSTSEVRFRKWREVFRTHKQIWERMKNDKVEKVFVEKCMPNFDNNQIDKILEKLNPKELPDGTLVKADKMRNSDNFAFKTLQDTDLLRFHAYLLFSDVDTQDKFVQRVKRVASSFTNVRQALHKLSNIALGGLAISDKIKFPSPVAIILAVSSAAELAGEIIYPLHLIIALDISDKNPKIQRLKAKIEEELPIGTLEKYVSEYKIINKLRSNSEKRMSDTKKKVVKQAIHKFIKTTGIVRRALVRVLEQEPVEMSLALLRAEENFIKKVRLDEISGLDEYLRKKYDSQERRVYGLSIVIHRNSQLESIQGLGEQLERLGSQLIAKFGISSDMSHRGRLPDGIFTLIEDYLDAVHNRSDNSIQKEKRENLWNALVRFAQKVLFVVNHESLFRGSNGKEAEQNVKYVRVLQAVGNSILVQIDALRQEEDFKKKLEGRKKGEIAAINRSTPQLPQKVIEDLLASLLADLVKSETELKQVQTDYAAAKQSFQKAESEFNDKKTNLGTVNNPAGLDIVDLITKSVKREVNAYELLKGISDQDVDDPLTIRDKVKKIKDDVIAAGTKKSSKEVVDELLVKFNLLYDGIPDGSKQQKMAVNLYAAIKYLSDESRSFSNVQKPTTKDAFDVLSSEVKPHYDSALDRISKAVAFKSAEADLKKERKVEDNAESLFISAQKNKTSLSDTIKAVNHVKFDLLAEIDKLPVPPSPGAIYNRLSTTLKDILDEKKKSLKADPTKKSELEPQINQFNNALAVVVKETLPMDPLTINDNVLPKDNPDAKDVMDQLIAILRYEYLQEVRQNGEGGGRASNLAQALKTAYIQREGMIYLRPAMAYLRTSFTATSLQRKAPLLKWKNMLSEHGKQSLFSWMEADGDAEAVAEIDKQFWQNINRVRVRGVGNTNYVIVKDDVGNWYVKSYSTDVGDIINSAKNLAMFGAGAGMGTSLPTSKTTSDATDQQSKIIRPKTTLERKHKVFDDQYRIETINVLKDLQKEADSIKVEKLKATWTSSGVSDTHLPKYVSLVDESALKPLKTFLTDSKLKKEKDKLTSKIARETLSGLQAFRRFHKALDGKLEGKEKTSANTTEKKEVSDARKNVNKEIKGILDRNIKARKSSIKKYESAVVLINEMTKP